jgi:surfeit locus 1 family protein
MLTKYIFPLFLGVTGSAILVWLGMWQWDRLDQKQALISDIRSRMTVAPQPLPMALDPVRDKYMSVDVSGRLSGEAIHVLTSRPLRGPGYRIIAKLQTSDGAILIDRGFVVDELKSGAEFSGDVRVTGNLLWPNEMDRFIPKPDIPKNIWFGRDLPHMARILETSEVLIVARSVTPYYGPVLPWPVGTDGIPNNHLQYLITWFSMAILWFGMTVYWVWRIRLPKVF